MPYSAGSAWLQVMPSFVGVSAAFDKQVEKMGLQLDAAIAKSVTKGLQDGGANGQTEGAKAGANYGDGFSQAAKKGLSQAREDLRKMGVDEAKVGGDRAGDAFAGAFGRRLKSAAGQIPDIQIDADTTDAEAKLAAVKRELADLSTKRIGVDVDDGQARAQLTDLKRRLDELALGSESVRIKVDAAAAAAELEALRVMAERVDRSDPTVRVNTEGAAPAVTLLEEIVQQAGVGGSRLGFLIAIGAALGTTLVPAAAAAAVAVGAIGIAAASAGAGLGVMVLGFSGISGAVQAINKYQNDAQKSAASLEKSQNSVARSTDGVASAQQSLANTQATVASAARRAAQTVVDAQRSVVDAQREAQHAQVALTQAYQDARRAQEDQVLSIRSNALAQRQATLDVAAAKKALDALLANPRATQAEREQAQITFEQRTLQYDELAVKQKRLAADKAVADKAGIAGSTQVTTAQEKVRSATENVAKAQQRVADAMIAQTDQQRQGAFQIQQSQQAIVSAMRAAQSAAVTAGVAGGAALQNMNLAMAQLGPAGQRFALFLTGLRGTFLDLRNVAQAGLLPGVQQAITGLFPYLGKLRDFISRVAVTLGESFVKLVNGFKDPAWRKFFGFLSDSAVPALRGMFTFTMNIARGLASLIVALGAFNTDIGSGLIRMSEAFATWADRLQTSAGFQKFLAYVRQAAPAVLDMLKQMVIFIIRFVVAAAPIGLVITKALADFFRMINSWPLKTMTAIATVVVTIAGALLVLSAAVRAWLVLSKAWTLANRIGKTITDQYARAHQGLKTALDGSVRSSSNFGFQLGNINPAMRQTISTTEKMSAAVGKLRTSLASITSSATAGLSAGISGGVATAKAGGTAVTGAMQDSIARYTTAITTATGRVGLFAKANEVAMGAVARVQQTVGAIIGTEQTRYMRSITAQEQAARAYGRAQETVGGIITRVQQTVGNVIGTEQTRYMRSLTVQEAAYRAYARAQEAIGNTIGRIQQSVGNVIGTEQTRYMRSLTAQEVAYRAFGQVQQSVGNIITRAHEGTTAAVTAALGRLSSAGSSVLSGVLTRVQAAASNATLGVGRLVNAIGSGISGAATLASRGVTGLVNALGGPWMIAIIAATAAITIFTAKAAEQKQRIQGLVQSLLALGGAYRQNHDLAAQSVKDVVLGSRELTDLIRKTDLYGLSVTQVAKATAGDREAQQQVLDAMRQRKQILEDLIKTERSAQGGFTEKGKQDKKTLDALNNQITALDKEFHQLTINDEATAKLDAEQRKAAATAAAFGDTIGALKVAFTAVNPTVDNFQAAIAGVNTIAGESKDKLALLADISGAVSASQLDAGQKASLFRDVLNGLGDATASHGGAFDALSQVFSNIAGSALSAADKTDLLTQALRQLYGAAISQNEADEALVSTQAALSTQIATNSSGYDLNTARAGTNRSAILANRDALEAALEATRTKYVADLAAAQASGDVEGGERLARIEHDKATTSILNQIDPTYRNSAAVHDLVRNYGDIPPVKATQVSTPGLDKAIDDLITAHAVQIGLSQSPPWNKSQIQSEVDWLKLNVEGGRGQFAPLKAEGGPIGGFSPSAKADNIPAWVTAGEWVQPVASVDYYGHQVMEALRRRLIPRELLNPGLLAAVNATIKPRPDVYPGDGSNGIKFADGGLAQWPINIPTNVRMPVSLDKLWQQYNAAIAALASGSGPVWTGPITGDIAAIQGWLRAQDGVPYVFGATGPRGWDCSGLVGAVWALVHGKSPYARYFSTHNEAPFFPVPGYGMLTAGWTNPGERGPGGTGVGHTSGILAGLGFEATGDHVRVGHNLTPISSFAHIGTLAGANKGPKALARGGPVHPWTMDTGGWLQPGWNPPIWNGTGGPEPVLNSQQWQAVSGMAAQGATGGNTYQFAFRDTTLTAGKLRAMQDADALRARVGRAR